MDIKKFLEYVVQDNRTLSRMSALEKNNHTYADDEENDDEGEAKEQTALENIFCSVCKIEISNVLFLPCRHLIVCSKCYPEKAEDNKHCSSCKTFIEQTIIIASRS